MTHQTEATIDLSVLSYNDAIGLVQDLLSIKFELYYYEGLYKEDIPGFKGSLERRPHPPPAQKKTKSASSGASFINGPFQSNYDALTDFYTIMNGDEWVNKSNWKDKDVCYCLWYGITCLQDNCTNNSCSVSILIIISLSVDVT